MINLYRLLVITLLGLVLLLKTVIASPVQPFTQPNWRKQDSLLVTNQAGETIFAWQPDKPLIPASTLKILTALLAIDKWGLSHRFTTDFWFYQNQLWVQGYGDPYLISEELDIIVAALAQNLLQAEQPLSALHIDGSYFKYTKNQRAVLGRSHVSDPYNAPMSAVAANFNTVFVRKTNNQLDSAEAQTPLTATARQLAQPLGNEVTRINLVNQHHAQQHFAELLTLKLQTQGIHINSIAMGQRPAAARLLYRHKNSHTLETILRGVLLYSNNFIANQLFLLLSDEHHAPLSIEQAQTTVKQRLSQKFNWSSVAIDEGAGLSHKNRLSAAQLNQLLTAFQPYKTLLKQYQVPLQQLPDKTLTAYAKTGTLEDVHTFAGYLELPDQTYQFVFMFNRPVPVAYRQAVLAKLVDYVTTNNIKRTVRSRDR